MTERCGLLATAGKIDVHLQLVDIDRRAGLSAAQLQGSPLAHTHHGNPLSRPRTSIAETTGRSADAAGSEETPPGRGAKTHRTTLRAKA